jgi:hypothetical protein
MALIQTCVDTHDTATYVHNPPSVKLVHDLYGSGLSPEIVHFRIPGDQMGQNQEVPPDWYIKGTK